MKLQGKPKQQIEQLAKMLPVGRELRLVKIGMLEDTSPGVLQSVKQVSQEVIKKGGGNLPDKRPGEKKEYTPPMVTLEFSNGQPIDIVLEDITNIKMGIGSISLIFDWGEIQIHEYSNNYNRTGS